MKIIMWLFLLVFLCQPLTAIAANYNYSTKKVKAATSWKKTPKIPKPIPSVPNVDYPSTGSQRWWQSDKPYDVWNNTDLVQHIQRLEELKLKLAEEETSDEELLEEVESELVEAREALDSE